MRRMRTVRLLCTVLLAALIGSATLAGVAEEIPSLEKVTGTKENQFSCLYNGLERRFSEYAPEGKPIGIVLMLHGYGSSGEAFRLLTKMDETANARGYTVVYPDGSVTPEDKTSGTGWNSGIGVSSSDDIGFLRALARYLQEKYGLTKAETYAAGFSNGGFMMYRLALEGQNEFAAVAGVAAMMPAAMWAKRPETVGISLLQINGTKDEAVPMKLNGSDRYAKAPAIEDVIDYFAAANSLEEESTESVSGRATLTKHYSAERSAQVWHVLIREGGHSWTEEKYCGFDMNAMILDFFDQV